MNKLTINKSAKIFEALFTQLDGYKLRLFWKCIKHAKINILSVREMNCAIQKGKITSYHSPSNFWLQLKV